MASLCTQRDESLEIGIVTGARSTAHSERRRLTASPLRDPAVRADVRIER